ncbi:MAG: c-type cytochrome [Candidatus Binatus sp.]
MILGWLPPDVSTFGPSIDSVIKLVIYIVGTAFILAEGTLLAFLILYRRRAGGRAAFVPGKSLRELAWVLVPVVVVAFLDVVIDVRAKPVWDLVKEQSPAPGLTVKLEAFQFGWEFIYPGPDGKFGPHNLVQTTTLIVPAGQVVRLLMTSKDVIHSFYVPQLRLRQDVLPGREIPTWFEVTRPGTYEIGCSQLCGISHFAMKGILKVLTPADYQQWSNQNLPKPTAGAVESAPGAAAEETIPTEEMFVETCSRCHGPQGFGDGPDGLSLATHPRNFHDCKIMARDSDDFVFHEIKGGSASVGRSNDMPSWGEALTDDQIRSLRAYVRHFCKTK